MGSELQHTIDRFWEWFKANEEELYDEFEPSFPIFQTMVRKIHAIDKGLVFDVDTKERGVRELIISADGNEALFPVVMQVVGAAPEMERWSVRAFRPRREGHLNVVVEGQLFETANMFYRSKKTGSKVDIEVWFIEPEGIQRPHHVVAEVVVANLLGEYAFVKYVRKVSVHLVDQEKSYPELEPMVEIHSWWDELYGSN